jgi:hypothetical protein
MNVIILTPDRVGSTLLQRLITVYANINEAPDQLTINLHELTNGIVSYHNDSFNRTVLGKKEGHWGYHQNLQTVTELLKNSKHGIISRIAHYHIKNRRDSLADQLDFYRYLNENFYVIAARRQNLFEHAMSWCIATESKKLNVYSHDEKFQVFKHIQEHGINVQPEALEKYLNQYQEYMSWVDNHFQVNSYFEYDRDLPNIENFILNLNVFKSTQDPLRWQDRFDISWHDWNRMHYLLSLVMFDYEFDLEENKFMQDNIDNYTQCRIALQDLQDQGVLVSGIPIKLHTLKEKAKVIKNISNCLEHYNHWIGTNAPAYAVAYQPESLEKIAQIEHSQWASSGTAMQLSNCSIPKEKLLLSDLKFS